MKILFLTLMMSFSAYAHSDGCYTPSGDYWYTDSYELNTYCTRAYEFGEQVCSYVPHNPEGGADENDYLSFFITATIYTCIEPVSHQEFSCRIPWPANSYCP